MSTSFGKNGIVTASGIEVGENLVTNSNGFNEGNGATGIKKYVTPEGYQKVVAETGNSNWCRLLGDRDIGITQGENFVFSVKMKSDDSTTKPTIYFTSGMGYYALTGVMSNNWSTFYYAGTWSNSSSVFHDHFGFSSSPGTFYIKDIKLELGSTPTPWIPNSADYGVVPTQHGFAEQDELMKVYEDYITTTEFIEY